ncbi:hypothetical protein NITGR_170117 [Nitrospina gracilis 3/211]|uniref:Uncharacterized protein n=1 Tax=Nitrospina gracilis (strain 3/211) TaxID=1266370 RepID=M1YW34_NITG3|nr:hypothetical protein [Nitrospina gracilis]CCQ89860.1 hypothetical protein NITGR_170117 [Nitrospina gracilis 3/211]
MRFPIKPPPKIKQYVVLSLGLHLAAFTAYQMIPPGPPEAPEHPPVKVKYVPKEPEEKKKNRRRWWTRSSRRKRNRLSHPN